MAAECSATDKRCKETLEARAGDMVAWAEVTAHLSSLVEDLKARLAATQDKMEAKDKTIENLKAELAARDAKLSKYDDVLSGSRIVALAEAEDKAVEDLRAQLAAKEAKLRKYDEAFDLDALVQAKNM